MQFNNINAIFNFMDFIEINYLVYLVKSKAKDKESNFDFCVFTYDDMECFIELKNNRGKYIRFQGKRKELEKWCVRHNLMMVCMNQTKVFNIDIKNFHVSIGNGDDFSLN